jgi:hypothetical protein
MKMRAVEQWAADKPLMIALSAPWIASSVPDIQESFEQLKEWSLLDQKLPPVERKAWYRLYRQHRNTMSTLRIIYSETCGEKITDIGYAIYKSLASRRARQQIIQYRPTQKEIRFAASIWRCILLASFRFLSKFFSPTFSNPVAKAKLRNLVATDINFAFFVKVTAPCWILYGIAPVTLYRQARQTRQCDLEAIDKLLRIDSLMIHEPRISNAITSSRSTQSQNIYESLLAAPNRSPDVPMSRKSLKYSMGGLIAAFCQILRYPLTAPEIRELYNAIVKDSDPEGYKNEKPEDLDFAEIKDDSFYRSIIRYKEFWLEIFAPDKTKSANVRAAEESK